MLLLSFYASFPVEDISKQGNDFLDGERSTLVSSLFLTKLIIVNVHNNNNNIIIMSLIVVMLFIVRLSVDNFRGRV